MDINPETGTVVHEFVIQLLVFVSYYPSSLNLLASNIGDLKVKFCCCNDYFTGWIYIYQKI